MEGPAVYCADSQSWPELVCCDIYGNAGGDWTGCIASQLGIDSNISEDPLFCLYGNPEDPLALRIDSPCAAENNPECGQIGARPIGCDFQGIPGERQAAASSRLLWIRPNPVTATVRVYCRVPESGRPVPVRVSVHDAAGRLMDTLLDGAVPGRDLTLEWDTHGDETGCPVPAGSYFLRLQIGRELLTQRFMVIR